jgi:hypothetical protein
MHAKHPLGLVLTLVAWLALPAPIGMAAEFPAASPPGNAGINIGVTALALDDGDFAQLRETAIKYVRFDLLWNEIENVKGHYDWGRFDRVFARLARFAIRPVVILDYNNRLYDPNNGGIRSEAARDGYAKFAAAAVARYNRKIPGVIWEIWNEPNADGFWRPRKNPDEYMALLKRAARAMRWADPTVTIINGGILELYWHATRAYLERCFELGLLTEVDGLGIHLYGGRNNVHPERIVRELAFLRSRMAAHGARADFPILNTEFGARLEEYANLDSQERELRHAETYVRMYLLCLLENIRLHIWYEWRWKQGFSGHAILNSDGTPRKAHGAIRTLLAQLDGYRLAQRMPGLGKDDFVLVFERGARRKLVAWTAGAPHSAAVRLTASADSLGTSGMMGEAGFIRPDNDALSIRLTGSPIYIDIGTAMVEGRRTQH